MPNAFVNGTNFPQSFKPKGTNNAHSEPVKGSQLLLFNGILISSMSLWFFAAWHKHMPKAYLAAVKQRYDQRLANKARGLKARRPKDHTCTFWSCTERHSTSSNFELRRAAPTKLLKWSPKVHEVEIGDRPKKKKNAKKMVGTYVPADLVLPTLPVQAFFCSRKS